LDYFSHPKNIYKSILVLWTTILDFRAFSSYVCKVILSNLNWPKLFFLVFRRKRFPKIDPRAPSSSERSSPAAASKVRPWPFTPIGRKSKWIRYG
jgi:hypothetical protein